MSIFSDLHKCTASTAFASAGHRACSFAGAHIAQRYLQAARIFAISEHFVCSRLDFKWGAAPYPASAGRRSIRLCAYAMLRCMSEVHAGGFTLARCCGYFCIISKTLIYRKNKKRTLQGALFAYSEALGNILVQG